MKKNSTNNIILKAAALIGLTYSFALFSGCREEESAAQKKLFTQAAQRETHEDPMTAAELYRQAASLDPTSPLGVQALDRAGKMDVQYEKDQKALQERIADTNDTLFHGR